MLEPLPRKEGHEPPRASLLALPGELTEAGIWMGGAHTPLGGGVELDVAGKAWFFDLAGDMPASYRSAGGRWFVRVFPDVEGVPHRFDLLGEMVRELAADPAWARLWRLMGVRHRVAFGLMAMIGQIGRFATAKKLVG